MPTYDKSYNNFGRPLVPDDSCKDSAPRHPRLWRRFLKVFTIYVHGGHLGSTDHDHFSNLSFPHPKEAPHEIWAKLAQRLQRRSHLKMLMGGGKVITIAHPEQRSGELKKKSPTPPGGHGFWRIMTAWTILVESYKRNIPAVLYWNRSSGFWQEDF